VLGLLANVGVTFLTGAVGYRFLERERTARDE
jgi:hypothetical protein